MHRRTVVGAVAIALVLSVGIAVQSERTLFEGEGDRILIVDGAVVEITPDEAFYVRHGWQDNHYPGQVPDFKDEYEDRSINDGGRGTFQLFIDGREVKLNSRTYHFPHADPARSHWHFYVQFDPYYFEPGDYELVGVWDLKNPHNARLSEMIWGVSLPRTCTTTLRVLAP